MLFAEVVRASEAVASTRARSTKIATIADLLRSVDLSELPAAVGFLTGEPLQGKIGVGWRTVSQLDVEPAASPSLEILDVDRTFTTLAGLGGPGSQAARAASLTDLYSRATGAEQWFLGRLLVGELRQGALAGIVTDAVAKAADVPQAVLRRAAMLAGDLPRVAVIARRDGASGLAAVHLTLLRPVQPMLAQTAESVKEALDLVGGAASVEWKLDGVRVQIHRAGDEVRIYTRNLNEVTERLPGIVGLVQGLPCTQVVLDGEAMGWAEAEGELEAPDRFQHTMSRFGRGDGSDDEIVGLDVRFFDILHLDGEDLLDLSLVERLTRLELVAGQWRIPGQITSDVAVGEAVLEESLATGHEGVMVKAASSPYEAGRRGGAWRKVKPVRTLDLVVLAAEWGHGRRQGWLSNLHLGARDPERPGEFVMVGKTFKGLTDELLAWQTERFQELAVSESADRDAHVVWVRPEQVVVIALDGVQVSTRYPGGVALRFARVKRYRDDKDPDDADTIQAVRALL